MIRMALIGCGNMGGSHRRALELLRGRARLMAAVDPDLNRAGAAAQTLGCDTVASEYSQVLDDIDAAIVAVPHHLHYPIGMDLLRAGKHVLMEKPMANTETQCLDLIRTAKDAGVTFMVAYCMRFHPLVVEMERLIKAKTYGEVFQLSIWTVSNPAGDH